MTQLTDIEPSLRPEAIVVGLIVSGLALTVFHAAIHIRARQPIPHDEP